MTDSKPTLFYTLTDEAPALATYAFLPIIRAFVAGTGIRVEERDISLAGRILAQFPDQLTPVQRVPDALAELGALTHSPDANIIKLPNISASVPQLMAAIAELQAQGYDIPNYPEAPATAAERETRARYDRIKGSAVNPVLREGNSDRRAPKAVKEYARQNPHSMGAWSRDSRSRVATMASGDFRSNERSLTLDQATLARIEHVAADGTASLLKAEFALEAGEIIDATYMSRTALLDFLAQQIEVAREAGVLFSIHLKATMMKVSDPIIFGHAVRIFFKDLFDRYATALAAAGADPNHGFGDVVSAIATLSPSQRAAMEADIARILAAQPGLAMVDSKRGITNLHVPSDVIVDASMPAMIRSSGQMWNAAGQPQDTLAVIPDSCYASVYQCVIDFCREHGAFDPTTMGSVPNVGLMAQKAEEYGSHDKTFEIVAAGTVRVVDAAGHTLLRHAVAKGDIWRMCQVKDAPIRDWVGLAVTRARATGSPAVFWLDPTRAHDAEVIKKVERCLAGLDTTGLELPILSPAAATRFTLARLKAGADTISVTGNVLRDYLTDLFPILEVGTSAKMLSIVPLMKGGRLFETGAGGSAPKHVQQFNQEGHLRWDSLGEFLALAVSFEHLGQHFHHRAGRQLGATLDQATASYLLNDKSPSRDLPGLDNRGSQFYLALYWSEALAAQVDDGGLAKRFAAVAAELSANQQTILAEFASAQGAPVEIGGYYHPDRARAVAAMRPSPTFNRVIDGLARQGLDGVAVTL